MAGTRSSARQAAKASSSPASSQGKSDPAPGTKRKATPSTSPSAKRGKTGGAKEQTTIEATMPAVNGEEKSNDAEMTDKVDAPEEKDQEVPQKAEEPSDAQQPDAEQPQATEEAEAESSADKPAGNGETAVEVVAEREEAAPSSILEKGIIYFFFRGRVGIDEPSNVSDVARSYVVLRPLPIGAKLGEGPIGDDKTNRLLALPKKVLPKSPKDRFMMFVEKANISMDEIKETLSSSDYSTKTAGDRHTPAAAPIGEGVYAITQTGRESHLAYILTIPSELSDVQRDVGLQERGSFVTSAKNPESSGPASAALPQKAEFPKEILDEFAGRGWNALQPRMLNYENAQFLIIGHGDDALEKAAQPQDGEDKRDDKETPLEEVEKLEHEDEIRVKHLKGDQAMHCFKISLLISFARRRLCFRRFGHELSRVSEAPNHVVIAKEGAGMYCEAKTKKYMAKVSRVDETRQCLCLEVSR